MFQNYEDPLLPQHASAHPHAHAHAHPGFSHPHQHQQIIENFENPADPLADEQEGGCSPAPESQ